MALRFSMKGVLLLCLMGVHVDKKLSIFFFHFVVNNYDFFIYTGSMKININKKKLSQVPPFWVSSIKWIMQHSYVTF